MTFLFLSVAFLLIPWLCVTGEWPVPKSIKCNSTGTFHCKNTGKYEDPFDFTCTRYFLCNDFEHETVEIELKCPENTLYDPFNKNCSSEYKCICDDAVMSSEYVPSTTYSSLKTKTSALNSNECEICSQCITSVGTKTTDNTIWSTNSFKATTSDTTIKEDVTTTGEFINATTVNFGSSSLLTTLITSDTTTSMPRLFETTFPTEISTTSTSTHKYCSNKEKFTCIRSGRFANPNDSLCKSYFYCYVWSDGRMGQYLYSCSVGLFNPSQGTCDLSYKCPCSETLTTETYFHTSTIKERSSPTNTHSISETTPISTSNEQPFSSISHSAAVSNITRPSITTQSASSLQRSTTVSLTILEYCNLGGNFTCTETGRFSNPNDPSCNSYFYCYGWPKSEIKHYLYSCSIGLFNPSKGVCDISYSCPCTETSTIAAAQESLSTEFPIVSSTTANHCNTEKNFTCIETGRFVHPNDFSCKSYFYCYIWANGTVGQYLYSCSIGLFDPSKEACDLSYVCPCPKNDVTENSTISVTTQLPYSTTRQSLSSTQLFSTPESTTDYTKTAEYCNLGENFTCSITGRFANPDDSSCDSYFYCYVWSSGQVDQYLYSCSVGLFNPRKGACDTSYICPCTAANKFSISSNLQTSAAAERIDKTFFWPPWLPQSSFNENNNTQKLHR